MTADAEIALFLARMVLAHTRMTMGRVLENATLPASALIARMLFHQQAEARRGGVVEAAQIMVTQDELSTMCGLSRKTVSRALQNLKRGGVIAVDYGTIAITDSAALALAAGLSA